MRRALVLIMAVGCGGGGAAAPAPVLPTAARAAVPAGASVEQTAPSPREDMSLQLGGMRLGMTAEEFTTTCRGAQGTLVRIDEIDLSCSVAPVPLKASGAGRVDLSGQVAGKFCGKGATLCELVYTFRGDALHRDEQTAALALMLESKYGPPSSSDGPSGAGPMARCQRDRAMLLERGWVFGPTQTPPHPTGLVKLVFRCDLRVSAESHDLTLLYSDESGMRYRVGDHEPRGANY